MTTILLGLIRGYQKSFSKILPPSCRYYPSCSQYTYEAVERYGWLRGGWMGAVAFPEISGDDPYAALGVVGAMKDIKKYTAAGSTVYVFGL